MPSAVLGTMPWVIPPIVQHRHPGRLVGAAATDLLLAPGPLWRPSDREPRRSLLIETGAGRPAAGCLHGTGGCSLTTLPWRELMPGKARLAHLPIERVCASKLVNADVETAFLCKADEVVFGDVRAEVLEFGPHPMVAAERVDEPQGDLQACRVHGRPLGSADSTAAVVNTRASSTA